ncbi:hypothetical protein [Massilia cavernae]|uniref:Lipoprotein n=1 Tax=Massilia cavernae TaxID=2320864 RepID=A0A418Y8F5_9BURK|nr:hypothetical protein [Massilia cavernae]RJG27749.1 hypothetical protein D3872_00455 [Massilia cavernae]
MKKIALIAALLLGACGGSSRHDSPPPSPPTPPVSMVDVFFTAVQNLVSSSPDNTEAVAIDSTVATTPDDAAPVQFQ